MQCKKCTDEGTIILRTKDYYCVNCFIANTNHKFRACIGKNKILTKNEKVLICTSGGLGSAVLIDLVHNGMCMDNHKKLRIVPVFLHLIGAETNNLVQAENVIKQCKKYDFDVYLVHISQYMAENLQLPTINTIPPVNSISEDQFNSLLKSLSNTTRNDFMSKVQRNLFIRCADKLESKFIFTGETTSTLAINLLSSLALGRGSQVEHDVGFCDARNRNIKIIKPMKDISHEELNYYSNMKQLIPMKHDQIKANSLQSAIAAFVTDLQDSFPATISTVCKTADKIGNSEVMDKIGKCVICESDLDAENSKLTALEATKFSRTVSYKRTQKTNDSSSDLIYSKDIEEDVNRSLFPHVHKKLCYGCSRNYTDIDMHMPNHVQRLLLDQ